MELPRIECVILAAGSSSRLGRDKALIHVGSRPLIRWFYDRFQRNNISVTVVANENNSSKISEIIPGSNVVVNLEPDEGRTGSLKKGVSSIDIAKGTEYRLVVVPVDRPGFSDSTLRQLIESEKSCCPVLEGKGGHPLLLSSDDVDKIRKAPSNLPLREIVNPARLQVLDKHLHLNIDTPQDLERLQEKLESVNEEN